MSNRVVVFGGTGFVGSHIMALLGKASIPALGVSRSGAMPRHWQNNPEPWMGNLQWQACDAAVVDESLFDGADVVISCIGSPPLPTFTQAAFKKQLVANGDSNVNIIRVAARKNIQRFILIGADIPAMLQTEKFAYYLGKLNALTAAQSFASSQGRFAAVLQPGGIYGLRATAGGFSIPLHWFMHPAAVIQRALPDSINRHLPAHFVSVDKVAATAVDQLSVAIGDEPFRVISNAQIEQHLP